MPYVGQSVRRKEDPKLVRGAGTFVADVQLHRMVHAAVLRSPVAHARITNLDVSTAAEAPGVLDVISAADLEGAKPIPMRLAEHPELRAALQYPLARERVRYVGEPVAVVVAQSRYEAEDLLHLVDVEYEPLPAAADVHRALEGEVPLHDDVPGNLALRFVQQVGDVAAGLEQADEIIEETFYTQRHSGVPLETRGLVADFDAGAQTLTVWGAAKVVHFNHGVLADALDMPASAVRLIETDVGGGFGVRGELYPEDFLIPLLARRLGRPVSWIEDRAEHLKATNHSREQWHAVRVGVSRDGRIVAFDERLINDMGAYIRTHGATVPTMSAAYLPGPYKIRNYRCRADCVLTNKTPTGTYRAPGRFEVTFVRERVMDLIAERLGLDPVAVRKVNFVEPTEMPYDTGLTAHGTPVIYDSGNYAVLFDKALQRFGYDELVSWCEQQRSRDRAVGVGIGCFVEKSGYGPWEYARVELDRTGYIAVYTGAASLGQGLETVLAQIVADELSADLDHVRVIHGDTHVLPYGNGSFASRASVMAGSAALEAARKLRYRILSVATGLIGASDAGELVIEDGHVRLPGRAESAVSFAEVVAAVAPGTRLGGDGSVGAVEEAYFTVSQMVYPYGADLALVEVDRETGHVDILRYLIAYDVGKALNPTLVEGQIIGGFAQGLGGVLLEELAYDPEGQLVAASLMDYLIPTASELPELDVLVTEDAPSSLNPLGIKGAGEGGTVGVAATVANAICDALGTGTRVNRLPLSPERVRKLVRRGDAESPLGTDGDDPAFPEVRDG